MRGAESGLHPGLAASFTTGAVPKLQKGTVMGQAKHVHFFASPRRVDSKHISSSLKRKRHGVDPTHKAAHSKWVALLKVRGVTVVPVARAHAADVSRRGPSVVEQIAARRRELNTKSC